MMERISIKRSTKPTTPLIKKSIDNNGLTTLTILSGSSRRRFKKPVVIKLPSKDTQIPNDVFDYITNGLAWYMPSLIEFALQSTSIIEMAKHLSRHLSGSLGTLGRYIYGIHRYCSWLNKHPDQLIAECVDEDGDPRPKQLARHASQLDDFIGELNHSGLAPGTIQNYAKAVKALYAANRLKLDLPRRMSRRVVNEDRAPKPEELQRLIEIGDLREKVIISMMALGGFREGTLCKLRYYHVRDDLEKNIIPVHIHVEADITKGKYHSYDTFIGQEAVDYLKAYLEFRKRGSPRHYKPPEEIHDDTPLIRNEQTKEIKPISTHQVYTIIHNLYIKAGLLNRRRGSFYEIRPHSIRKYFRTQLASLGVPTDYIEYMMGHTISTYHDIQMKGIDFLRNIYAASGLAIRPKMKVSQIEMLKEIIRALGGDPERAMIEQAFSRPHRTVISDEDERDGSYGALKALLRELMRKELLGA
ncbi:MAG: tyrosine-type recombinase/integrase [Nitrososphaerales archaeon]